MRTLQIDDRQTSAEDCFDNYVTAAGVSKEALYNVLHAKVKTVFFSFSKRVAKMKYDFHALFPLAARFQR
jgi:hypothetical protein